MSRTSKVGGTRRKTGAGTKKHMKRKTARRAYMKAGTRRKGTKKGMRRKTARRAYKKKSHRRRR